jgi:hypothetical protein
MLDKQSTVGKVFILATSSWTEASKLYFIYFFSFDLSIWLAHSSNPTKINNQKDICLIKILILSRLLLQSIFQAIQLFLQLQLKF